MFAARTEEGISGQMSIKSAPEKRKKKKSAPEDRKFGEMLGGLLEIMLFDLFYYLHMVRMKSLEN